MSQEEGMSKKKKIPEEKINLFSRKGLQRMFPTAKIVRCKQGWDILFPVPEDFKNIDYLETEEK